MPEPRFPAVLFDVDGTLVDSNYLHIDAWSRAFADVGSPVPAWRIHRAIGMDSGELLDTLLAADAERLGDEAKQRHAEHYARDERRLRPFDGARQLLRSLADRGVQVVLATSAPKQEFEMLRRALQIDDAVAHYTTAEDVDTAKPAPDVVQVALDKAGVGAEAAVMIGDAVWDAQAAGRAGVVTMGVLTGGTSEAELREAGAVAVYDDVAQLLRELDRSPLFGD